jgi:hypothetical protein
MEMLIQSMNQTLHTSVSLFPVFINVNASVDSGRDDSELVSVVITVPSDGEGPYGTLTATSVPGVSFYNFGVGVYTVNATAATAGERETRLDNFLRVVSTKFPPCNESCTPTESKLVVENICSNENK